MVCGWQALVSRRRIHMRAMDMEAAIAVQFSQLSASKATSRYQTTIRHFSCMHSQVTMPPHTFMHTLRIQLRACHALSCTYGQPFSVSANLRAFITSALTTTALITPALTNTAHATADHNQHSLLLRPLLATCCSVCRRPCDHQCSSKLGGVRARCV